MSEPFGAPASERIAGSFRDPSGYVFRRGGRIFRAVDGACHALLRGMQESGLLDRLTGRGPLIATSFVDADPLRSELRVEHPGYEHFLEHAPVPTITYPYEWTLSMLADAGRLTLDLQEELLAAGLSLKDASAFNVQFVDGRPRFIDLSSFERPRRLDIWVALGQFNQMFTFPLLLCRHHGWDLKSYFLGNIGGRDAESVARALGALERWRPRALLDVTLPALLGRKANAGEPDGANPLEKPGVDSRPQVMNLHRLRAKVEALAKGYRPRGAWFDYGANNSYTEDAHRAKAGGVRNFLETTRPASVLDVGCNTGEFSRLAEACGASVVAIDADHDTVELLYRHTRGNGSRLTPMVLDLLNPSPAVGFRNAEREAFLGRVRPECVLALALLHHLLVSGNLDLEAVCGLFEGLTRRDLVLEFVPPDDVQFRRLTRFRANTFADLTLDACRQAFLARFEFLGEQPVAGSGRVLLFLRRRSCAA